MGTVDDDLGDQGDTADQIDAAVPVDAADLARLRSRSTWTPADRGPDGRRRAECEAARGGHVAVALEPGELPHCRHCGTSLSPDDLRRAGIKGRKA